MAQIKLEGNIFNTKADLPEAGNNAPDFALTKEDLGDISIEDYKGKRLILNIFPSLDTSVCAASVRKFNQIASMWDNDTEVLCISKDLPFAMKRFCVTENLDKVTPLSSFRDSEFGEQYGVEIIDGPLKGLFARSVVVIDKEGKIHYTQLVPETTQEPDYDAVLASL